jgi:DNA processing protein
MRDPLEMVALSLLYTEGAARRPRHRAGEGAEADPPAARDIWSVEQALDCDRFAGSPAEPADARRQLIGALRERARCAMTLGRSRGLGLVVRGAPDYPALLEQIADPPPVLWTLGRLDPGPCAVAIVGSRAATEHGLEAARRLAQGLARAGLTVVSGLARGVDGAAHDGALQGRGVTVGVLGSGADVIYPAEHAALAERIALAGALVTEFPPGTPPHGWHFPRRNRIISGLCHGVVVVEAADRSGSLITARLALEQGRDVMAVPGSVLSGRNRGAHALLRDGARVVETADDVIETLGLTGRPRREGEDDTNLKAPDPILRQMEAGEACDLDGLAERTGVEPVRLLARLAHLELAGWVRRVGGGRFVKAGGNVLR